MGTAKTLLSIVIPMYNVEKFLPSCLDSLIAAIDKDVEVILVDDGSSDSSLSIAKEYAKEASNFIVLSKENGGVSSARNLALQHIHGTYTCFVDSDDKVDSIALKKCIEMLKSSEQTDLFVFPYFEGNDKDGYLLKSYEIKEGKHSDLDELNMLTVRQKLNEPWKKIFLSHIILEHDLRFPEDMFMGEDICFFLDYLDHICSFTYFDLPFYYYRKNDESACSRVNTNFFAQQLKVYSKIGTYIKSSKLDDTYKKENEILLLHIITRDIQVC